MEIFDEKKMPTFYVGKRNTGNLIFVLGGKNKSGSWETNCFRFIAPKNYLVFQSFDFERHLMKVIPKTRRAH